MLYLNLRHKEYLGIFFQPSRIEFIHFFKERKFKILKNFIKVKSFFRITSDRDFPDLTKKIMKKGLVSRYRIYLLKTYREFSSKLRLKKEYGILIFPNPYIAEFFRAFQQFNIFFRFSFHAINKKIRKFSRGRSGKYKIACNYIPKFKRQVQLFKIFTKNLKTTKGVTFFQKLTKLFFLIKKKPELTIFFKFKKFSSKYIFNNKYRNVLLNSN